MTVLRPGHGPAAPARSAARHRLGTRLDALDLGVRRDVVRLLTLLALLPLLLLLARGAVRLPHAFDPLALYGLAVLAEHRPPPSTSPTAATTTRPYARCAAARATPRPSLPCPRSPG